MKLIKEIFSYASLLILMLSYFIIRSKIGYPDIIENFTYFDLIISFFRKILVLSAFVAFISLFLIVVNELLNKNYLALIGSIKGVKIPFYPLISTVLVSECILLLISLF